MKDIIRRQVFTKSTSKDTTKLRKPEKIEIICLIFYSSRACYWICPS